MRPTFDDGDLVRVDLNAYRSLAPAPGHIVLARHPYKADVRVIKRCARVTDDGRCFLLGDNPDRLETTDSRSFGAIAPERVLGRVVGRATGVEEGP